MRLALMIQGIDLSAKPGGVLSCTHDDEDNECTAEGLRKAVRMLREEGEFQH